MSRLWSCLERLRREPEAKRQAILWWSTSLLTFIIVGLWLLTFHLNGSSAPSPKAEVKGRSWGQKVTEIKNQIILGWQKLTK